MNRSGYDTCDEDELDEWHRTVADTIASPDGQAFLRELAAALDAMPEKVLITDELIDEQGNCCAIGAVCRARGIDVGKYGNDTDCVAELLGASGPLVAEVIDLNDCYCNHTPEDRWHRMRRWVERRIKKDGDK